MEQNGLLTVSSSPHIRRSQNVQSIMRDVLIAMIPAVGMGMWLFGVRALLVVAVSTASCVFFEWAYRKIAKKTSSIYDLSAAVTGVLLGLCLPPSIPLWLPVVGGFFAIVIVKQLYGGIGKNFLNPALAARCFLFSWAAPMTTWMAPRSYGSFFSLSTVDVVTTATPLASMAQGKLPDLSLLQCLTGVQAGSIGEVSAIALLIGGLYLLIRGVINLRIPGAYILTVALLTFLFPRGNDRLIWMLYQLLSGGLMFGAMFMANDYATSPTTPLGQVLYGVGCGALTVFIRYFGSYAEGVSFAILIMNVTTWLIDKYTMPRQFGVSRKDAARRRAQKKEAAKA